MKWLLLFALLLSACSPAPETDIPPIKVSSKPDKATVKDSLTVDQWEERFQQVHGSAFDPLSRLDREKMAMLKGEAAVKESLTTPTPEKSSVVGDRQAILDVGRKLVGQSETHGANRSPVIDAMNRLTGVPMGSPYCASFNAWCYFEGNAPSGWPKSAWSPDWVRSPTWTAAKGGKPPKPADAFGIYFASKSRVAHTGLIETWGDASAVTIEGNTSPSAEFGAASDRDGDGIWRKRRLIRQIYAVRDWVE